MSLPKGFGVKYILVKCWGYEKYIITNNSYYYNPHSQWFDPKIISLRSLQNYMSWVNLWVALHQEVTLGAKFHLYHYSKTPSTSSTTSFRESSVLGCIESKANIADGIKLFIAKIRGCISLPATAKPVAFPTVNPSKAGKCSSHIFPVRKEGW